MTVVVKGTTENVISLPGWLMERLALAEGDSVTLVVDGDTLHLKPLERFLNLRGVYQDDDDFEKAIDDLNQAWQQWTHPESV